MTSITITGIDKLQRKLGKAASIETLRRPMNDAVNKLWSDIAVDPPPPKPGAWAAWARSHGEPKASQIRGAFFAKGQFGRTGAAKAWKPRIKRVAGGLQGKISNNAKHIPWVQSHQFQVGFHRGRWPTDKQVVDQNRRAIVGDFQRAIDRALSK